MCIFNQRSVVINTVLYAPYQDLHVYSHLGKARCESVKGNHT